MNTTQHNTFSAKEKPLHRDPNKAMQQMMDTIDALRSVYERETDALEKMDTNTFLSLQADKEIHALAYQAGINEIIARKDEMKKVDPALKDRLNTMQKEFSDLAVQNMAALERMNRAVTRLNGTIREVAKQEVKKQNAFNYNEIGRFEDSERKNISISISEEA